MHVQLDTGPETRLTRLQRTQLEERLVREQQRAQRVLLRVPYLPAAMASQIRAIAAGIDDALRTLRTRTDSYGQCAPCGHDIAFGRLYLAPWASHCLDCEHVVEMAAAS